MARFIRDEKRTYPLMWLTIGGVFAASAAWAVYAELVTRVPWEKQQQAFFDMELEQSKQALERANAQWEKQIEPALKPKIDRRDALLASQKSGAYADAKRKIDQLNQKFAAAELGKTFGSSDLDEAYYYRNIAEYERDRAQNKVRAAYHEALASKDPGKAQTLCDAIYIDPPQEKKKDDTTEKMFHLEAEMARMRAHVERIDASVAQAPSAEAQKALLESREAESKVIEKLEVEVKNQRRVDASLKEMGDIDGPADPPLTQKDPAKRAEERKSLRDQACKGHEETRTCITWRELEPVDLELKSLEVEIAKAKRGVADGELRQGKALAKAKPEFKLDDMIHSIVGPFQIQQVVMHWIEQDRDVDGEQVDRCMTCHAGADAGTYASAEIPRQFRTHPWRSTLFTTHPIEKFGCTSCHQGQGRATDELAHSGWHLETKAGKERWHFAGDHYWEDPLLPMGKLTKIIVDERNDELEVKVGKGKWAKVAIDHKSPADHDKNPEVAEAYEEESEHVEHGKTLEAVKEEGSFFGSLQAKLAAVIEEDAELKKHWRAVARKLDNRVQLGLEQRDPNEIIAPKDVPTFSVRFPKPELAQLLGYEAGAETAARKGGVLATGNAPPAEPIRSDAMEHLDKDGRFHPPRGSEGLQVPDGMRNRFIEALPEVESSCLRCHTTDVDLKSRASRAKYNLAKLDYEKAEAERKKDPEGYKKAHDGIDELPTLPMEPSEAQNPVPTFSEGRALFKKLNCTGCHILDGFAWDRNSGPSLDNVTAKISPEFLLTWIRNPRGFRAKTRMPNLWPKPLDPASKRPEVPGTPDYEKWQAQMREETVAIASYLVERSDNPSTRAGMPKDSKALKQTVQGYANVPGATAEKGKKAFESYGCQGCHARSDKDTADEKLPEPWRSRERDIAPTLANMGGKTNADWIAYWVENPARYWHGTKMPNLRLSREESASIGLYVASMKSEPLDPAQVDKADTAVVSDAAKRNERVPCSNANGQLMTRVECGEKLIGYYGCFGCHAIAGYEKSAPIAPELGGFAKKDVSTLDFGYAIADHHLQTTETFATLKLDSPRIYRRDRIELKMADFDLSPREIRAIVTFLKGLTPLRPRTAFKPAEHADYSAALEGRQIVEDYNCRACHVIEEHGGDIDHFRESQLSADAQMRAPYLNGEGARVQPEWLFSFLREPGKNGIRPWLHPEWVWGEDVPEDRKALRMPTFNFTPDQVTAIVRYFASWDGQDFPYQTPVVTERNEGEKLYALSHMLSTEAANCLSCHYQGDFPVDRGKADLGKMAPNFNNVARRLRPEWVKAWLLKPQNFLPYTKMTAFWASVDREKDNAYWPAESDPFRSPVLAWNKAPAPPDMTVEKQVELVRDFLFSLPPDAVFPKPGEEASSPLVKKMAEQPRSEKDEPADKGDKNDKGKGKKAPPKKSGAVPGPLRLAP